MPTALTVDQYGDVIKGTLKWLGEDHWTDLSSDLQKHPAARELVNDNKISADGGTSLQFNLMIGHNNQARAIDLAAVDDVAEVDVMYQGEIPWRHAETKMAIEERLIAMNANNARRVFDIVKVAKASAMVAWVEFFETLFWSKPADSSDVVTPYGVQIYITTAGATSSFDFNGGNPTGFSSGVGNINSTTIPRWSNGNALYTAVSKPDFVAKLREAATKTDFESAVDMPTYDRGKGPGYYCGYRIISALETLLENQNDRLGSDIAPMDGKLMFRGTPITWVPKLEADTSDPFYGIHWGNFGVKYLAGEWMRQTGPNPAPVQHRKRWTFWDTTMNLYCDDRRRQFVLSK